eukprot:Hpha_TRINITY_DN36529_c0_g1::TRINITY_DN36529_c0_g1_i1::g.130713::m.130713
MLAHGVLLGAVCVALKGTIASFSHTGGNVDSDPRRAWLCFWLMFGILSMTDSVFGWFFLRIAGTKYAWLQAILLWGLMVPVTTGKNAAMAATDALRGVCPEEVDELRPRVELYRRRVECMAQRLTTLVDSSFKAEEPPLE